MNLLKTLATISSMTMLSRIAGIVAAPVVVYFIATGQSANADAYGATVLMTRLMFLYIGFMSFVALSGGILNTWREFKIPAVTPVLLNVCFILAALYLAPLLK